MTLSNKSLTILVIEDNDGDYALFESYLEQTRLGVCNLLHSASLAEIHDHNLKEIDIVFLDLSLPDSTGLESFTRLNALLPDVPIVVLSGLSDEAIALNCIALGAQDYLLKDDLSDRMLEKSVQYSIERKKNLRSISLINKQYELIGSITHDVFWSLQIPGMEVSTNKHSFFHYSGDDIGVSLEWWFDKIHPCDRDHISEVMNNLIQGKTDQIQEEYRFLSADGSYKYVFNRAMLIRNEKNEPAQINGAMMDVTERRKLQDELTRSQLAFQKQLTEASILGQEKVKEHIGKELHDNINQILASVKLYLDTLIISNDMKEELLHICRNNTISAIDEIRKLSHSLIPPSLGDHGLIDAVKDLIDELNIIGIFRIKLHIDNFDESVLDENKKLMVFRIIQEQINNILKYSKAGEAIVHIKIKEKVLFLSISDNGIGFDTSSKGKGIGLRNIDSRVSFYSGKVQVVSAPGKGTALNVALPV